MGKALLTLFHKYSRLPLHPPWSRGRFSGSVEPHLPRRIYSVPITPRSPWKARPEFKSGTESVIEAVYRGIEAKSGLMSL
jgi:hypothetical protein